MIRLQLLILLLGAIAPSLASAQSVASADSTPAIPAPAAVDSLAVPGSSEADSLAPAITVPDSTSRAAADSLDAGGSSGYKQALGGDLDPSLDLGPLLPPWTDSAVLDRRAIERLRARGLDELVEAVPGSYLRVQGDRGFPGYYDLSPIDGAAVESFYDGIPTRAPSDMDPGIWDLSAVGTGYVDRARQGMGGTMGGSALELEREPAEWGTTIFRAHFDQSKYESYLRGISATTPRAPRTFRLDYEEWKTEEGYNFSDNSSLGSQSGYGRAKMRRWVLSGGLNTGIGRVSLGFGRGRRYYNGTMNNVGTVDRWTGQVWAGWDRSYEGGQQRVRAYHLDWHDHDFIHSEERDASRMGFRYLRMPRGDGLAVAADYERWSARFRGEGQKASPEPSHLGRMRLGWIGGTATRLEWKVSGEAAYAEHVENPWGGAGEAELRLRPTHSWWIGAEGGRQLRTPTLLESFGFQSFDLAGGFYLRRQPGGVLPYEIHDRVRVFAGVPLNESGHLEFGAERWRLREGIGWVPEIPAAVDGNAFTVGGLGYDLDQLILRLAWPIGPRRHGVSADGSPHYVLGQLPLDASRGGGWPERGGFLTLRWWHDLLSERDQFRIVYRLSYQGAHYDDLLAPFSGPDDKLDQTLRQDLRLVLKLRDAELFLEVNNFMDATIEQVAGTRRRGRDLIWGLYWPFWN